MGNQSTIRMYPYQEFENNSKNIIGTVGDYCLDGYTFLSGIKTNQQEISNLLSIIPIPTNTFQEDQLNNIAQKLTTSDEKLETTKIIDMPETKGLIALKKETISLLSQNKSTYITISIQYLKGKLNNVSGDNTANFNQYYNDSEDFKLKVLEKINEIEKMLNSMDIIVEEQVEEQKEQKEQVEEQINELRKEALVIYNLKSILEGIQTRAKAGSVDLNNILKQMFLNNRP